MQTDTYLGCVLLFIYKMHLVKCLSVLCRFSAGTCKRLCYMNIAPDEIIRSLFYNRNNNSLITVSVYSLDNYTSLRCRSTPIECALYPRPSTLLSDMSLCIVARSSSTFMIVHCVWNFAPWNFARNLRPEVWVTGKDLSTIYRLNSISSLV